MPKMCKKCQFSRGFDTSNIYLCICLLSWYQIKFGFTISEFWHWQGGLHPLERHSACRQPWWSCYRQDLWQVLIVFCLFPFIVLSGGTLSQWPTSRTQWWQRGWGRRSRPSHSSHDLFKLKYVCGGDLRCFVAGQICRKFTHFPSVKFSGLKICACKKNDKYQVCPDILRILILM